MRRIVMVVAVATLTLVVGPVRAPAAGLWLWPVTGPLLKVFDPPSNPYGSGHRGIDIGAEVATPIVAPADGVVSFAGTVGGALYLTITHGGGLQSTASWLSDVLVRKGDAVLGGQVIARSGWGHVAALQPHLHFSVRLDGQYVDPLDYLRPIDVGALIRLAPLGSGIARVVVEPGSGGAYAPSVGTMSRLWTRSVPSHPPATFAVLASLPSWQPG